MKGINIMKSYTGLWDKIIDEENLLKAYYKARKGKRHKREVINFSSDLIRNIYKLHTELKNGIWRSHKFNCFYTRTEVKLRYIQAPSFEDRIVHHAIMLVCLPIFEKSLIPTTYACIKDRGNHRAVLKVKEYAGYYSKEDYVLQIDLHKFFPSIDINILLKMINKMFRETKLQNLFKEILNHEWDKDKILKGLPIGALTSQVLANLYLTKMDHYIKEVLHIKHYVRYMDDLILFFKNKEAAWSCLNKLKEYVSVNLNLELNPKSRVYKLKQGIDFAGYRTFKNKIHYRKRNIKQAIIRFRRYNNCIINDKPQLDTLYQRVSSFLSYIDLVTFNYYSSLIKRVMKPILHLREVIMLYEKFKNKWSSSKIFSLL